MSDTIINEIVRDHAMLVTLHIRHSKLEIKDAAAAVAAAEKSGAKSSAAYFTKKNLMFGADHRLKKLAKLGNAMRATHNHLTMAWGNGTSNYRMLPVVSFMDYTKAVSRAKKDYQDALEDFIDNYENDARKARVNLNLPNDDVDVLRMYPKKETLEARYGIDVEFEPISEGAQFRNLPDSAASALAGALEARVTARFESSLTASYERLRELCETARDNLNTSPTDEEGNDVGQRWKNSTIFNIVEHGKVMKSFNLKQDPAHDNLCEVIEIRLGQHSEQSLTRLRKVGADRSLLIDDVAFIEGLVEKVMEGVE